MDLARWRTGTFTIKGVRKVVCQDAAVAWTGNWVTVLAVSDGLGSHRLSHLGAQAATELVLARLSELDNSIASSSPDTALALVGDAFDSIVADWNAWSQGLDDAEQPGPKSSNVQATLACCFIWQSWLFIRSIGDSIVCVVSGDSNCELLMSSARDSSSGVATIGRHSRADVVRMNVFDPTITQVLLSTDGIERAIRRYPSPYDPANTFLGVDPQLDNLLSDLRHGGDLRAMRDSIESGLVDARGGKGDDVGVAVAINLAEES